MIRAPEVLGSTFTLVVQYVRHHFFFFARWPSMSTGVAVLAATKTVRGVYKVPSVTAILGLGLTSVHYPTRLHKTRLHRSTKAHCAGEWSLSLGARPCGASCKVRPPLFAAGFRICASAGAWACSGSGEEAQMDSQPDLGSAMDSPPTISAM